MQRCKTCISWTPDQREPHVGTCDHEKFVENDRCPPDGVGYYDYEGYLASFLVGEDFGCVHHSGIPATYDI